jgi:inner membrane protein
MLKALRVHPIQYLLVSAALTLFYLLLLALSEHIGFNLAYLVAALACTGLLAYYVSHVLGSFRRGLGFAALLALLYATLWGLLQSEDNSLLLGSILLMAVLALIMVLTRKLDWYRLGETAAATPTATKQEEKS